MTESVGFQAGDRLLMVGNTAYHLPGPFTPQQAAALDGFLSAASGASMAGRAICSQCDGAFPADKMVYGPDPYQHEIYDDDTPVWLCRPCQQDRADDR